jgi:hypothetical protein
MTISPIKHTTPSVDADLQKVEPALRRAAQSARELALRTGTPCYVWRDGKLINIGSPQMNPSADTHTAEKA